MTPNDQHALTGEPQAADGDGPLIDRLTEAIRDALQDYRRAVQTGTGGAYDGDRDRLELVRTIARQYEQHRADPQELRALLLSLADDLSVDDVRALRLAGDAAVAVTPEVVHRAGARGMHPQQIADGVGLTVSRVYALLREERQKTVTALVEAAVKADAAAGNDPHAALTRFSAALAHVPEEHRETAEQYLATLRRAVKENSS
ncbi:hypothetical protein ABZ543_08265 [Streptomyces roseifaciens]